MTATNGSIKPKLTPEVQQRLCKVADWVLGGATREEAISRTMREWQLERRQAQKYLRRVHDRLRCDAEEQDLQFSLYVIQQQRLRVLGESWEVMRDKEASNAKINYALRHLTAVTRILSDVEKTALASAQIRALASQKSIAASPPTSVQPTSVQPPEAPAEQKKDKRPELAKRMATLAAQLGLTPPANSPLPAITAKPARHRPLEMNDKEFAEYLARLEAPAHANAPSAPATAVSPKEQSGKDLGNGQQIGSSAPSAR